MICTSATPPTPLPSLASDEQLRPSACVCKLAQSSLWDGGSGVAQAVAAAAAAVLLVMMAAAPVAAAAGAVVAMAATAVATRWRGSQAAVGQ